jgi:hypothetical protein
MIKTITFKNAKLNSKSFAKTTLKGVSTKVVIKVPKKKLKEYKKILQKAGLSKKNKIVKY